LRLRIKLRPGNKISGEQYKSLCLPMQYNHLLQGAIYSNINKKMAEFLHNKGFLHGNRTFKFFTFSRLMGRFELDKKRKEISFPYGAELVVSSPLDVFCSSLANCIMHTQDLKLGSQSIQVESVGVESPVVETKTIELKMLSPVVVYSTFLKPEGGKYTCYFQPGEEEFARLLAENLRRKYEAYYNRESPAGPVEVAVRSRPKFNLVTFKGTIIKGYSCRLRLSGPQKLLQMGLDAGLGGKNGQGFGCVELV